MSSVSGLGGLCEVRRPLPPTERLACARNRLKRSGTAMPTAPRLLWSQNPRTLKCAPLRKKPWFASYRSERNPVVVHAPSTTAVASGAPSHVPGVIWTVRL